VGKQKLCKAFIKERNILPRTSLPANLVKIPRRAVALTSVFFTKAVRILEFSLIIEKTSKGGIGGSREYCTQCCCAYTVHKYPFVQFMQNVCSLLSGFMINYALPLVKTGEKGERGYMRVLAKSPNSQSLTGGYTVVDSRIGLLNQPASLCSLAARCDNPMPGSTISYQSVTKNFETVAKFTVPKVDSGMGLSYRPGKSGQKYCHSQKVWNYL
jgi:hypothetical protein